MGWILTGLLAFIGYNVLMICIYLFADDKTIREINKHKWGWGDYDDRE